MSRLPVRLVPVALAAVLALACSDDDPPASPGDGNEPPAAVALDSVVVLPRSVAHPGGILTMSFTGAMAEGMEAFVDLHQGGVEGPVVPMSCLWSPDRVTLICLPDDALAPVPHTLHMGAGLQAGDGSAVDMTPGLGLGGTWMTGDMGGMHDGPMQGSGWMDAQGHAGMLFSFTPS